MVHRRAVFDLSVSELVMMAIILGFVMAAGRVGKLGAAIGTALGGKRAAQVAEPEASHDDVDEG